MACPGCIARQRRLVRMLCKNPDSTLCRKAKERLEKMTAAQEKAKIARPEGASNTDPASDQNVR